MFSSEFWHTFWVLLRWSLEAWTLPPVLILSLISALGAVFYLVGKWSSVRMMWRSWYWLIFTQLLFIPITVAIGAAFERMNVRPAATLGSHIVDAVMIASVLLGGFWIFRLKGIRWLAVSLIVLQEILLFGALFIAAMAVTGDWL